MTATIVHTPDDWAAFCSLPGFPLDPTTVRRQAPDRSVLVGGAARCSLWWKDTPPHVGHRLGYIGHFAVSDAGAAGPLLGRACADLAKEGCTLAVGPMDGSTWHRYRLITERGSEPPFFLEPDNPDDWPGHFESAGFVPLAQYYSALCLDLAATDPRMTATAQRMVDLGIVIRPLDPKRFDATMHEVFGLSLLSFRNNFLYTPIDEAAFLAQYAPIRPHVRPELVLLAEKDRALIGYVFAIPDLQQARRGVPVDTVIVKTMAVHPDHGGQGLGGLLIARCHESAHKAGFRRAIHALFHEDNRSGRISGHTASVMRRYTLFARPLTDRP